MCSINHDLKAIFIHNHKSGGTYISYMLHKYYGFKNYYLRRPDHDIFCLNKKKTTKYINYENRIHGVLVYYMTSPQLNKKMNMTFHKWATYYKFAFIRNPYDKLISAWYHINRYNIPFKNYLNLSNTCNDVEYMHMFLPQIRNIIDTKGKININYIGKFETLEEDFQIILKNIGIKKIVHEVDKKLNKRNHKPFYEYYDQEALTKANLILTEDFKYLHFKKFDKINDFMNEYKENTMNLSEPSEDKELFSEDNSKENIEDYNKFNNILGTNNIESILNDIKNIDISILEDRLYSLNNFPKNIDNNNLEDEIYIKYF
jgi:hypothetical protein